MQLQGIHHLTAVSADPRSNLAFYTGTMGMRLVKKTVNQDDVSAYHLFYADGLASPGTDLTFFDWPVGPEQRGSGSVVRTALRVAGPGVLDWWAARLDAAGVVTEAVERGGYRQLWFADAEGQRLALLDDAGPGEAHPWARSPVPAPQQIRGLGPITASVADLEPTEAFATDVMGLRRDRIYDDAGVQVVVFAMGPGGPAAELHVRVEPSLPRARQGAGAVHHVAFRIPDVDYDAWAEHYRAKGVQSSGPVDRFYFRSLYTREPGGILYEIATDGPGFATDEAMDALGERLALPPFLEGRRREIEAGLKPI